VTEVLQGARAVVLALLVLLTPAGVLAAPKFPPLTGRIVDNANLLSPATEARLSQELAALEAKTGRQLVVATVPDLQGYEIEEYGYQLGRAWGIGSKDNDDGAILLVAPNQKRVRLEVGYGLEPVLTDALSSVIINREIIPRFKQGDFEGGVVAGADAVVRQLGLPDDQARTAVAEAAQPRVEITGDRGGGIPLIVIVFVLFWVLTGFLRLFGGRGRRRRGGSGLWWLLPMIVSSGGGRGGGWSGGGGFGGGGGFSGGGGSFGGGGASGRW
jgi:uncharacterized protein